MGVAFCEVDAVDINRYFYSVMCNKVHPSLVVLEGVVQRNLFESNEKIVPCVSLQELGLSGLISTFEKFKIDCIYINGQRIVDCVYYAAAKAVGAKVFYIQHGMYIPFMRRSISFFVTKFFKSMRYFKYSLSLAFFYRSFTLLVKLLLSHIIGRKRDWVNDFNFKPSVAWVYSEYWRSWHIKHYQFDESVDFRYMRFPDLNRFKQKKIVDENTVTYCYQTLVEDGRIDVSLMHNFYCNLASWSESNNINVLIKGHPRMSSSEGFYLTSLGFKIITDYVPLTRVVLGHYSTLLALWGLQHSRVVCFTLPGHPIDESFSSWAFVIEDFTQLNLSQIPCDFDKAEYIFGPNSLEYESPCLTGNLKI